MTVNKDNYIDPDNKSRWGFSVENGQITVGPETVGETGGVEHARVIPKDNGAVNNGGGENAQITTLQQQNADLQAQLDDANAKLAEGASAGGAEPLDSLSATDIKAKLDELGVEYKGNASQATLLEQLKAAQQPKE
ncbi:hypothetical protein ACQK5W_04235 [Pantoea sp. FN060301]|uniref:hypothetical protein n=1 Tax=Pantoea sp. FN060301 TaxID=3420380 RepID=UPI003D166A45